MVVLLDLSVTITLYICVFFINNPIRGNFNTLHCLVLHHLVSTLLLYIYTFVSTHFYVLAC